VVLYCTISYLEIVSRKERILDIFEICQILPDLVRTHSVVG